jgi:hypothetical protein
MRKILISLSAGIALIAGLLTGCGGGGGGTPATPVATNTTISGSAVKGPVNGATVTVRNASSGAILGTTTTSPAGTYSLTISYNGDVVIEVQGGNYIDEATGLSTPLNLLKAYVNASGGAQTAHLTPLTYIAYSYAGGTRAGFNTALNNLAIQFGLGSTNLLTTLPAVSGTVNDYGRVLRAMSKYVQSQNLANFDAFLDLAVDPAPGTNADLRFQRQRHHDWWHGRWRRLGHMRSQRLRLDHGQWHQRTPQHQLLHLRYRGWLVQRKQQLSQPSIERPARCRWRSQSQLQLLCRLRIGRYRHQSCAVNHFSQ